MKIQTVLRQGVHLATTGLICGLLVPVAWAQDDADEAETTIRLMGDENAGLPEVVTSQITLPPVVTENAEAVEQAREGLQRASEVRGTREPGPANGNEARERGSEMSREARENAENRGRADENRPDTPQPPENPGNGNK